MPDYISRHEAIRAVQSCYGDYQATRSAICKLPVVDAAPVIRCEKCAESYCAPHLHDRTDKIVFDATREEIEEAYETHRDEIAGLVTEHMKDITELQGPWSIDLMLTEKGKIFLIDMAVAEQSAYWKEWLDRQTKDTAGVAENCGGKDEE